MIVPEKYNWISQIGTLPKMVEFALMFYGEKEIPGKNSNPFILQMAADLGIADIYKNDDTAWCALWQNWICLKTGKPIVDSKDKYDLLRAAKFLTWGDAIDLKDARLGTVLVFKRPSGGHVGLYIAETEKTYLVLGGNQSNMINFTEIEKTRAIGAREYYAIGAPASAKKYFIQSNGEISKNEK